MVAAGSDEGRTNVVRALVMKRYREQAEQRLAEKTKRYAKVIGVESGLGLVVVRDYKSRWDSCSIKGDVSTTSVLS